MRLISKQILLGFCLCLSSSPIFADGPALNPPASSSAAPILPVSATGNPPATFVDNPIFMKDLKTAAPAPASAIVEPKVWSGSFEAGINGSSGNTDVLNVRIAGNLRRETDENIFTSDLVYGTARQNGILNQDKALYNARDEILFGPDNPWALFTALQVEYDQFRDYEFRVGLFGGVSYTFLKDDNILFKGRIGLGETDEIGKTGVPSKWVTEALFGWDFDYKFTDRQKFTSSIDVYPSLTNFGQYRVRAKAAYEVLIDPSTGATLKVGIQDRYDTDPGFNYKRNDLDYFTAIMFKF
ncbi:DUF481 domain-containing protein [Telmatocola sphagniphila]|uniref:DUF481 domain-containing protein n=1 Tax=Telmatocola sphagniphila TaxID=1123043 RepID=A0A8E6B800_9BACT|nr:DUF481 domain-containing protein [Telmatocola sphagniphila]QVL32949.1 DUF481 domain-containing protein [Telmatocola sphagniphila]